MRSRGLYELKRHFQREHHLTADQRFRARFPSQRYVVRMDVHCMGRSWKLRRSCSCIWMCRSWITNARSIMMLLKGSRLRSPLQIHGL